jgi:hypothetical protein
LSPEPHANDAAALPMKAIRSARARTDAGVIAFFVAPIEYDRSAHYGVRDPTSRAEKIRFELKFQLP